MVRAYTVMVTPLAESDLQAIYAYLAADSEAIADLVYTELLKSIASLSRLPERFPFARDRRLRRALVRAATAVSYRVYYVVEGPTVRVLRVWHTARRPPPRPLT